MSRLQLLQARILKAGRQLGNKKYRPILGVLILAVTFGLGVHFFVSHPEYIKQLARVSPGVVVAVIALNIPAMGALAWAYDAMLGLCGKRIPQRENILLTAYSSIANFFGPLESGPALRTVYLKARHGVRVRDYTLATLLYLALFAGFSALFLLIGVRPWWQTLLALVAVAGISGSVIRWFLRREKRRGNIAGSSRFRLRPLPLASLIVAVFLQLSSIAAYFFVELHAVDPTITVGQAVSYTGAANFSLFVSLTPDAIGIREAFLIFSQQLHHVSTAAIVNANIIDRGAYFIFLIIIFAVVLALHARDRLRIREVRGPGRQE